LVDKHASKGSLGIHKRKWEYNKNGFSKKQDERGVDWFDLAQDRVKWQVIVNTEIKLWFP
jgi:hypothetical protein